jgi:hypothetical protein
LALEALGGAAPGGSGSRTPVPWMPPQILGLWAPQPDAPNPGPSAAVPPACAAQVPNSRPTHPCPASLPHAAELGRGGTPGVVRVVVESVSPARRRCDRSGARLCFVSSPHPPHPPSPKEGDCGQAKPKPFSGSCRRDFRALFRSQDCYVGRAAPHSHTELCVLSLTAFTSFAAHRGRGKG